MVKISSYFNRPNFPFSSSEFEVVDGVLILGVKSESNSDDFDSDHDDSDSDSTEGLRAASYKVRIQHTPENAEPDPDPLDPEYWSEYWRQEEESRRKMPTNWSFRCSCPSYAETPTICKHIGVCLIVNFLAFS